MTDENKEKVEDQKAEAMLEEIRTRVFDRYAEIRGMETQQSALQATLDALQDITDVPKAEIEKIAAEVQQKHFDLEETPKRPLTETAQRGIEELTFERLRKNVERGRRGFVMHLIPYVAVNSVLIYLNVISSSFPWAVFPVFGWGIGLMSQFMAGVVFPMKDLKRTTETIKTQVHKILIESWPGFLAGDSDKYFNNVYRLVVTECSKPLLEEYFRNSDSTLSESNIAQMSIQLVSLQNQFASKKSRGRSRHLKWDELEQKWK